MNETNDRPKFIPAKDLDTGKETDAGSFDVRILMECVNLLRKTTPAESCLMHIMFLRGWLYGTFSVPHSALALQAGTTTRTVSDKMRAFEKEGLVHIRRQGNQTHRYTLTHCDLIERAIHLFKYRERREELFDAYVAELNESKKTKAEKQKQAEEGTDDAATEECPEKQAVDEDEEADHSDVSVDLDRVLDELAAESKEEGQIAAVPNHLREKFDTVFAKEADERARQKAAILGRIAKGIDDRSAERAPRFDLLNDTELGS